MILKSYPKRGDRRERKIFLWRPTRLSYEGRARLFWLETILIEEHFDYIYPAYRYGWDMTRVTFLDRK